MKHVEDKPKQQQTSPCRKERLRSYADMTIYAIDPARCQQWVTTNFLQLLCNTQQLFGNSFTLRWLKYMHAACSHSPHNVLHSPVIFTA